MLRRILVALIHCYRCCLSPLLGQRCRFHPSCSQYALDALHSHSLARALWLVIVRLSRCHPWHPGGFDPVPPCSCDRSSPLRSVPKVSTDLHKAPFHQ